MARQDATYFEDMRVGYQRSRDRLAAGLTGQGYAVLPRAATCFPNIDLTAFGIAIDDVAVAEWLVGAVGVATIPASAVHAADAVTSVVRPCFAKRDATRAAAVERMARRA